MMSAGDDVIYGFIRIPRGLLRGKHGMTALMESILNEFQRFKLELLFEKKTFGYFRILITIVKFNELKKNLNLTKLSRL